MGFKTYFCDAYSPWQKGLVEKINSMIHKIFPKHHDGPVPNLAFA